MFMEIALAQAAAAALCGEVPVGAVIVTHQGEVVAKAGNSVCRDKDPTAHAELIALRLAAQSLGNERLTTCDIYTTLEPCPMCASAIALARLRRLYYGAYDKKSGGVMHGPRIFDQPSCHHKPEVYEGLQAQDSAKLLKEFFRARR